MASLGYTRQKAGFGGNDEYGSANTPAPSVSVDAPEPTNDLGYGKPKRGFATVDLSGWEQKTGAPIDSPAPRMYEPEPARKPGREEAAPQPTPAKVRKSIFGFPTLQGAQETASELSKKYLEPVAKNTAPEPSYQEVAHTMEVNLGRKPGVKYDDEPEIPVPFVPKAESKPAPTYSASASTSEPSEAEIKAAKVAQANQDEADESALVAAEKPVEVAKKQPEAAGAPEGLIAKKESVPSAPAKPERISRDKLMKMAGINDTANQQIRAEQEGAKMQQRDMKKAWDEATKMAKSGNLSEREYGLRQQAALEREGLAKGFLQQGVGAQEAYRKFETDPYNVKQVELIRREEELQAQAQAQAAAKEDARKEAERKAEMDERKQGLDEKKFAAEQAEKKQKREDDFNKEIRDAQRDLAKIKDQREYELKKGEIESQQRTAEWAKKWAAMKGERDGERVASLIYQGNNLVRDTAAQAAKAALDEARKYTGVIGRARAFIDGKDRDAEIGKIMDSYERHINDGMKSINQVADVFGAKDKLPQFTGLDRKRIEEAVKRRGPETSDDIIATFEDLAKAGEFGIKYLTPAGRAGTAFGMATGGMMGGQQQPAPQIPTFGIPQGMNYGNMLNQ
jgi:hypothetical protein